MSATLAPVIPLRPRQRSASAVARCNLDACLNKLGDLSLRHAVDLDAHHATVQRLDVIQRQARAGLWPSVEAGLNDLRAACERLTDRAAASRALSMLYGALGFAAECEAAS